ncbi:hypothetical protein AJ80_09731 [Polytolypa hystricis UAMH7299]|uniref:Ribosome maturation protein SDO1/SBDS N-terminal domain-containing protein n=1 Tax=Polytolypa hystricis (strain UAMH7299) TaxID=1447883 RepID=A0A2B7WKV3_POLH7|nr:hypothetical protein AJ80_09731 [Polytolypa hystricis UAMH7299]
MTRGNATVYKVFYKGESDDFTVYIEDPETVQKWKKDRSVPLAQVVSGWQIFVSHRQGAQGIHDSASDGMLDGEFGTTREEEIIKQILEKGEIQAGDL